MFRPTQLFLDFFRPSTAARRSFERKPPRQTVRNFQRDESLVLQAVALLTTADAAALAGKVSVVWNSRLTTTAGQARFQQHLVVLNPRLRRFGEAEIDRTLRHELAHLLAHFRAGRRRITPHGAEWRQACIDLGLTDEKRCHELPLPRRTVARRHIYSCKGCGHVYRRVRPFRRKVACLPCCKLHNAGHFHEKFRLWKTA